MPTSLVAEAPGYSTKVAFLHAGEAAEPWARCAGRAIIRGTCHQRAHVSDNGRTCTTAADAGATMSSETTTDQDPATIPHIPDSNIRLARALARSFERDHEVPDQWVLAIAALPLPEDGRDTDRPPLLARLLP